MTTPDKAAGLSLFTFGATYNSNPNPPFVFGETAANTAQSGASAGAPSKRVCWSFFYHKQQSSAYQSSFQSVVDRDNSIDHATVHIWIAVASSSHVWLISECQALYERCDFSFVS